jgi:hypothetical protein
MLSYTLRYSGYINFHLHLPGNEKKVVDSEVSCLHTNVIKESDVKNMSEEELGHKSDSSGISWADEHYKKLSLECNSNESFSDTKWVLTLNGFELYELVHDLSPDSIRTDYLSLLLDSHFYEPAVQQTNE